MSWLLTALSSSIGKKLVMAITGLLLCGFLVVHLAGNFLLYVGSDAYNHYAHALHEQKAALFVAEVGLLLLFLAHLYLAIATARQNRTARRVEYAMKESKLPSRTLAGPVAPENWMFVTGAIVLGFVLVHLADFRFELRNRGAEDELPHAKAVRLLQDSVSGPVYVVGCIFLGLHLGHGVASSFQTLGLNHPRYNQLLRCFGILFAIVIALGFISFPIWAQFEAARHSGP